MNKSELFNSNLQKKKQTSEQMNNSNYLFNSTH